MAKQVLDLDKTKKNPDFGSGFWIRILDPMLDPKLAGSPCRFQTYIRLCKPYIKLDTNF